MTKKTSKKRGSKNKLKSLLPKKQKRIMQMPEEKDEDIHWLFWVLVILVIAFLVSLVIVNWQGSSALLTYLGY